LGDELGDVLGDALGDALGAAALIGAKQSDSRGARSPSPVGDALGIDLETI
jgi:hypothetical protein